jgi:hypothetical protein
MATERQIAANRANAKKSTGPKTAAGLLKSSRNAFRHGLSLAMLDDEASATRNAISRALAAGQNEQQLSAATELAEAQLQLLRIRSVRAELMAIVHSEPGNFRTLRRLAALDRYERFAHTKRRRAARKLHSD